jgi:hypothetical protein
MTHLLKQIDFRDLRHIDTPRAGELPEAIKTVLLIAAIFGAGYLAFYFLLMACMALNISPWWAGVVFSAVYFWRLWKAWRGRSV